MKKKILLITFIGIIAIVLLLVIFYKNKYISLVETESEINTHDWYKETLVQYDIKLCNFDFRYPEYALITEEDILGDGKLDYELLYFKIKNSHPFSTNWQIEYTGGTTIQNTTFPELVAMVKEDCSQFQKAKGDSHDETINWSYSPAPTQEELDERDARSFWNMFEDYLPEAHEVFKEVYGNPYRMNNQELAELYKKIDKEGMNEEVYIKEMTTRFHNTLENITDAQKKKLFEIYGEWEGLSDKELADLAKRIQEELLSGEVSLD